MAILLYRGDRFDPNFFYHTGTDIDHSFFISGKKKALIVPFMNESLARKNFRGKVIACKDPEEELAKHIRRKTIHADFFSLSARMASRLGKRCRLKDYSIELLKMRQKKKPDEIANIRRAARITRDILDSLDLKSACTELDIEKQIRIATCELGLQEAFPPIVSSGLSTAFPHYQAGKRKIGSLVIVDYGVRYRHYCSDITRCFILEGDLKMKAMYENLQDVFHSVVDALPGCRNGKDVAEFAAKQMEKKGFPKMIHAIGHGIGLDVHELPRLSKKFSDPIKGSVVAIEPAFYMKRFGMRYEDDVFFDGRKARIL